MSSLLFLWDPGRLGLGPETAQVLCRRRRVLRTATARDSCFLFIFPFSAMRRHNGKGSCCHLEILLLLTLAEASYDPWIRPMQTPSFTTAREKKGDCSSHLSSICTLRCCKKELGDRSSLYHENTRLPSCGSSRLKKLLCFSAAGKDWEMFRRFLMKSPSFSSAKED